jgi:hypothetical protein
VPRERLKWLKPKSEAARVTASRSNGLSSSARRTDSSATERRYGIGDTPTVSTNACRTRRSDTPAAPHNAVIVTSWYWRFSASKRHAETMRSFERWRREPAIVVTLAIVRRAGTKSACRWYETDRDLRHPDR